MSANTITTMTSAMTSFKEHNGLPAPAAPGDCAVNSAPSAGATAPPYGAGPGTEPDPGGTAPDQEREIGVAPGGGRTTRLEGERPPPRPALLPGSLTPPIR